MDAEQPSGDGARDGAGPLRRFGPLAVLVVAMVLVWQTGLYRFLSLESLAENRQTLGAFVSANWLPAIALYMAVYAVSVALSLPGATLLTIAGGLLFGWVAGGAAAVIAATIGATAIFIAARTTFGDVLRRKAGGALARLADGFRDDAFSYLLFLRLVPAFPFWLVNLAPAFFGVPLRSFVAATAIGIIPGTFVFAYLGRGLDSVMAAQIEARETCLAENAGDMAACGFSFDPGSLVTPQLLAAFAALGVVALIPVAVRKWRSRAN